MNEFKTKDQRGRGLKSVGVVRLVGGVWVESGLSRVFLATSCFGLQVAVVKMKQTGQVYAMKIMNKWDMLKRGEVRLVAGCAGH